MAEQRFGDLLAYRECRIERGHRLLEDHRELVAAEASQARGRKLQEIFALEQHLAAGDAAGRLRHEAHDRERGDALAAARLADDAERAAALEAKVDAVDRAHLTLLTVERGAQPANLKQAFYSGQSLLRSRCGRACHRAAP